MYINTENDNRQALVTIELFQKDVKLKLSMPFSKRKRGLIGAKRGLIKCFSYASRRRLRHLLRNSDVIWKAFVTLTYPGDYTTDGRAIKRNLNAFLQFLRSKNIKYLWILEFQERGAPHFHILIDRKLDKNKLSERWYKIVNSGDEKHLRAGTQIKSIKSLRIDYLTSYIKKINQKQVPPDFQHVGRFWGASKHLLERITLTFCANYRGFCRSIRTFRRWYRAHLRGWNIKWKWRGKGFIALDGMKFLKFCYENYAYF